MATAKSKQIDVYMTTPEAKTFNFQCFIPNYPFIFPGSSQRLNVEILLSPTYRLNLFTGIFVYSVENTVVTCQYTTGRA
jgi:hypothetical protein